MTGSAVGHHHVDGSRRSAISRSTHDVATASAEALLAECAALDAFRRQSDNLYERVRALFFLYAIYRFHLPGKLSARGARRAA